MKGLQGDDPRYYKRDRHRQALRGPQRPGAGPPPLRRPPERARPARDLPARVPRPRAGGQGRVGDGRLQPRQRRVGLGQPAPAAGHPAEGVGLRRLRGLRLRGHRRHLHAPQAGGDGGGGVGARGHEGLRPRVRQRLPHAREGARARAPPGEPTWTWRSAGSCSRAIKLGMFDPPERVRVRADPVLGQRRAGARPARAARGAGVDRPAEERRRPAAAQGPRHDRRRRAERRRPGDAARQLQRHALAAGHHPRRDPERRLARHAGPLRARGRPRRGPAGPARRDGHRGGLPAAGPRLVRARAHRARTSAGASSRASRCSRAWTRRWPSAGTAGLPPTSSSRGASSPRSGRSRATRFSVRWTGVARAARLRRVRADGDRQRRRAPLRRRAQGPRGVERDERGAGRERAA